MKRTMAVATIVILITLVLSFTQAFAAPFAKKTPDPGRPVVQQTERAVEKDTRQTLKEERKTEKFDENPNKPDPKAKDPKAQKPDQPADKPEKPQKADEKRWKPLNLRGTLTGMDGNTLEITLKDGTVVTVIFDGSETLHIPGGKQAGGSLTVGMQVMVHALKDPAGGDPVVRSVNVIPAAPKVVHHVGEVTDYQPGAQITILARDGSSVTYNLTGARILPHPDAVIEAGSLVTIISPHTGSGGELSASAIVVHPKPGK